LRLIGSYWGFDYPRPLPPYVQLVGAVVDGDEEEGTGGGKESKENAPAFWTWVNQKTHNSIVLISMGSSVQLHPVQIRALCFTAATFLDTGNYYVLWAIDFHKLSDKSARDTFLQCKAEIEESSRGYKLMTASWIPQVQLLQHPAIALLVSHCGFGGVIESLYFGKPLLALPLAAEHYLYAEHARLLGAALVVIGMEKNNLLALQTQLLQQIAELIMNYSKLREASEKTSRLLRLFGSGREQAARWLNYALLEYNTNSSIRSSSSSSIDSGSSANSTGNKVWYQNNVWYHTVFVPHGENYSAQRWYEQFGSLDLWIVALIACILCLVLPARIVLSTKHNDLPLQ
jgi:UDP-N-acetylglucosamine transferase subunit ALG13